MWTTAGSWGKGITHQDSGPHGIHMHEGHGSSESLGGEKGGGSVFRGFLNSLLQAFLSVSAEHSLKPTYRHNPSSLNAFSCPAHSLMGVFGSIR